MAKSQKKVDEQPKEKNKLEEHEWDEIREMLGDAINYKSPVRLKFASKLQQSMEGIPEAKGDVLYMNVGGNLKKVSLDRLIGVEAL
ncbi:hypothetical protein [Alicyclobacillus fodiniaquatilis]|uniref:Uncharacterized protein n=1 Tax=Alicyclobacillus fodiniaquatilis TaxID=1661150 RepID=A0ABW4JIT6_9BACL